MDDRVAFLQSTDLLGSVPPTLLATIDTRLKEVCVHAGEVLFEEGEEGDAVYLVLEGELGVAIDGITLMRRTRGECVGEMALIDDMPRSAAAIAKTDMRLLRWERRDFQETLSTDPEVARGIFRMLTGRLREDVKSALHREREKERWSQDLARAREIQLGMLPSSDFILDDIELAGVCSPASEVGGDFYDYFCPRGDSLGLIIGDVTGHGFYAGLFVAMAKSCLHTQAQFSFSPRSIMESMRRTLDLSIIQRRLLMSCCYVLFDPSERRLHYANAGHPYPYFYRPATGQFERLTPLDPILGAIDASVGGYTERSHSWQPGDVLVMYTDGVTEARNASGKMFDHQRLEECIAAEARGRAVNIKESILASVHGHTGASGPEDDLTLVVVKAR